jgi:hypothetical protein
MNHPFKRIAFIFLKSETFPILNVLYMFFMQVISTSGYIYSGERRVLNT